MCVSVGTEPTSPQQPSAGLCLSALTPLWYSLQGILSAYAHLNSQLLNPDRLQVSNSSPHPLPGPGNSRQKAGAIVGLTYLGFHLSGIIAWLSSLDTVGFIYFVYFFFFGCFRWESKYSPLTGSRSCSHIFIYYSNLIKEVYVCVYICMYSIPHETILLVCSSIWLIKKCYFSDLPIQHYRN